ncbi:MAG: S-layer homology domain-containing protein [Patescibacteria group bacterium]
MTGFDAWNSAVGGDNSLLNDPKFKDATNGDYSLLNTSTLIDAGTDVSLTTDYSGNPIYGTPDMGAYEYQPPHTMGTNGIDIGAGARIYADGKFRDLGTNSGSTADLTITPQSGSFSTFGSTETRPAWLDVTGMTWTATEKRWTENSANHSLVSVHTIGGLTPNANYKVYYTKSGSSEVLISILQANSSGDISFTYSQGYSTVEFDVQFVGSQSSDTTAPAAPTSIALAINSGNKVEITWTDPSDSDLSAVEILRGIGSTPVSGVALASVAKGVQKYTDTAVSAGDTVKYILRAKDRNGNSSISAEYSITVAAGAAATATTTTTSGLTSTSTNSTTTDSTTATNPTNTQPKNRYEQAGVSESEVDSAVRTFRDLKKDAWYAPFVARMRNLAVLGGYPDGSIKPDNTINRAELAKIAAKAFGLANATETFGDVPDDAWYAPFVGALQQAGAAWTTGANYQPEASVTRGEAVWVLFKAAGIDLTNITVEKLFPDVNARYRYALAITYAAQNGIVNGYDNGNFGPNDTLTRGQVAKIVSLIKDLQQ